VAEGNSITQVLGNTHLYESETVLFGGGHRNRSEISEFFGRDGAVKILSGENVGDSIEGFGHF